MAKFSNELTDAEVERLAILAEEMGEAIQCIGKVLRHGYESRNPLRPGATNREQLQQELGDAVFAIYQLTDAKDLEWRKLAERVADKKDKIKPYLHHQ